jgi:Fe-S cluster assembly protein SufD
MDNTITRKEEILDSFSEFASKDKGCFLELRKQAEEKLQTLEFPTLRTEDWKYTRVSGITKKSYSLKHPEKTVDIQAHLFNGIDLYKAVFVNGFFVRELSSLPEAEKIIISDINSAKADSPELLEKYFAKYASEDKIFTALNTAYHTGGAFVYLSDNATLDKPLHLIYLNDSENIISQNRNLFVAGKNSRAQIIMTYSSSSEGEAFTNNVTEIFVNENAQLEVDKIQWENKNTSHISTEQVYQLKDSRFTINTITLNGGLVRNNLNIEVDAENCETNLNGLYLLNGNQVVDNHTLVDHKKPHCNSNELYKGVMTDKSTGVFNGKVFVRQDAQKTNAFQSNKNILLSDDATINTKPELEIYADDVKCSHGSTTGQMDDEAIFYLQARGISKESAMKLLMNAFASDVLEKIKIDALREKIEAEIEKIFK